MRGKCSMLGPQFFFECEASCGSFWNTGCWRDAISCFASDLQEKMGSCTGNPKISKVACDYPGKSTGRRSLLFVSQDHSYFRYSLAYETATSCHARILLARSSCFEYHAENASSSSAQSQELCSHAFTCFEPWDLLNSTLSSVSVTALKQPLLAVDGVW